MLQLHNNHVLLFVSFVLLYCAILPRVLGKCVGCNIPLSNIRVKNVPLHSGYIVTIKNGDTQLTDDAVNDAGEFTCYLLQLPPLT